MYNLKTRWWIGLGLLMLAPILLVTNPSSILHSQATATVEVAAQMDPMPHNCGNLAEPIELDAHIGQVIGSWPIWAGLPNSTTEQRGTLGFSDTRLSVDSRFPGWWPNKMGWFVNTSYHGVVKLHAYNLADQSPVYFDMTEKGPTTTAEIDPSKPGGYIDGIPKKWAFFPSVIWLSKAGCYMLEAEWDTGSWHQVIAAGRFRTTP